MFRTFIAFLLLTASSSLLQAQSRTPPSGPDVPPPPPPLIFTYVEQMPEFPGDINTYIINNLRYPADAIKEKIEGKVRVRFVVSEMGIVKDVTVVRSVHRLIDEEAVRVVSEMPQWKPGKQNGSPVSVYFTLPISFRLDKISAEKK